MKIAIDCRMYGNSGIGTYLREVLNYLVEDKKIKFLLIGNAEKLKNLNGENIEILDCRIKIFSIEEMIGFPVKEINKCDVFYTPNFNIPLGIRVPIFSTIHDVVFLDIENIVGFFGKLIMKIFVARAVRISQKIFTVSKFSKKRIEFYFKPAQEIVVTYNGISQNIIDWNKKNIIKEKRDFEYIIYVGNIKKHKGLSILLDAYEKAIKKGFTKKLVIVGNDKNFKTKDEKVIKKLKKLKSDNIVFTGYVNDDELIDWIWGSETLIQPSLYEGFGIPPLEALFLGKRPIISNIEVFKEVYSNLPVDFFDLGDSDSLTEKLLENKKLENEELIRKEIVNLYSYSRMAEIIKSNLLKSGGRNDIC